MCFLNSNFLACTIQVGVRLIELLLQTAFIQAEQVADDPPDLRPAFVHTLRRLGAK